MGTELERIGRMSAENPKMVFTSLYHFINEKMLERCHERLDGKKAVGVDRVTKAEYEENLERNLRQLTEQLKRKNYRPQRQCESQVYKRY